MSHRFRYLLAGTLAAMLASAVTSMLHAASSGKVQVEQNVPISSAQEAALKDYVEHRWRRVKATLDSDQQTANNYLDPSFRQSYEDRFHPVEGQARFKQCRDCAEYTVKVTERITGTTKATTPEGKVEYLSLINAQVSPLDAVGGPPATLITGLTWRMKTQGDLRSNAQSIEILQDDRLMHLGILFADDMAYVHASTDSSAPVSFDEPQVTPEQEAELKDYILGRYRRVKATIDHDRQIARRYLAKDAWDQYVDTLHPEVALPKFKQCADCEEFGIEITRMERPECSRWQAGDIHCHTSIEFRTQPIKPADASPRMMASKLSWRPADVKDMNPNYPLTAMLKGKNPTITITDDEPLQERTSVNECLKQAADGKPCR